MDSAIKISLELDESGLDEAQRKADKLKATLIEIQELIREVDALTDAKKKPPRSERRESRLNSEGGGRRSVDSARRAA